MDQETLNREVNQLLKGTHMGASIFQNLREKLQSDALIHEFDTILEKFHIHEHSLTAEVIANDGDAQDSAGLMGSMADAMNRMKTMFFTTDKEVIDEAVKDMAMAVKAVEEFKNRHGCLNEHMNKVLHIMIDDYRSIYYNLKHYQVGFS